jgi:hypothetical protein
MICNRMPDRQPLFDFFLVLWIGCRTKMTFAVQNAIPHVDELVREYLVFRGFPKALAAFDSDKRTDRLKGFQVHTRTLTTPSSLLGTHASCPSAAVRA